MAKEKNLSAKEKNLSAKEKNLTAKERTSQQKEKTHGKRKNLAAKVITMSSRPKRERGALGYFFCRDSCGPRYILNLI